jgi:hypothetical protein
VTVQARYDTDTDRSFTHAYDANNRGIGLTASDKTWLLYPAAAASTTADTANALNQYTAVGSLARIERSRRPGRHGDRDPSAPHRPA